MMGGIWLDANEVERNEKNRHLFVNYLEPLYSKCLVKKNIFRESDK
jgi:hypothetical protein